MTGKPSPLVPVVDVVAAVIRRGTSFLVCRRPARGAAPGRWEFPGGKVLPGESAGAALARELREELGIEVDVGPILFQHEHTDGTGPPLRLHFHAVAITGGELALRHHQELRFAPLAELAGLDLLAPDRAFVASLTADTTTG